MSFALTVLLLALALFIACGSILRSRLALFTLPCLSSFVILLWLFPQLAAAEFDPSLPNEGQILLAGLAILGSLFGLVGWVAGAERPIPQTALLRQIDMQISGLCTVAVLAVLGTAVVQLLILNQPAVSLASRQPSGLITILRTLAMLNPVALFCALLLLSRRPGLLSLCLVLTASATYAQELVFQIKRTSFLELGLVLLLWRYVVTGWTLKGRAVFVGLPLVIAGLNLVHEVRRPSGYRVGDNGELAYAWPDLNTLLATDWFATMSARITADYYEVSKAIIALQSYLSSEGFGWGQHLWNLFVFRWVPGQIVGADTKLSMMFDVPALAEIVHREGVAWKLGTTATGFADPFADFAVLGSLVFLANAWIAARIVSRGFRGSLADLAIAVPVLSAATVSLTHNGYALFMILPLVLPVRFAMQWLLEHPPILSRRPQRVSIA